MAIIALTPLEIIRGGTNTAYTGSLSTSNTYTFPLYDNRTFLHVKNGGGTVCVVTFITPGTVDGIAIADPIATVPITTGDQMMGPFRPETFADSVTGLCSFTLSFITSVTLAVFHLIAA